MVLSTTPTRPSPGGWTCSGARTSGSTGRHEGGTRGDSGGPATTSTDFLRRLGAALRRQRGGDDRLVRIHAGDGVDANARTDVARRRRVVPRRVGGHDGGDDAAVAGADALALPRDVWQDRRSL